MPQLNFFKIDVEGVEGQVLDGAMATISKYRPIILLEINSPLLAFNGESFTSISIRMSGLNYSFRPINNCSVDEPQYDLLCLPL